MLIFNDIGWVKGIEFVIVSENKPIKLRSYNGALCFLNKGKRIGLVTWKKNAKDVKVDLVNAISSNLLLGNLNLEREILSVSSDLIGGIESMP